MKKHCRIKKVSVGMREKRMPIHFFRTKYL